MKNILSPDDFKRLQELIEAVIAAHAQARETQENKISVPGFDREAFLGEKELYSDYIIGCASSVTHYQDRRITPETAAKLLDLNSCGNLEKYPHLDCFLHDENLQKSFPCALKELQTLAKIRSILLKISPGDKIRPESGKTVMIWNIIYILYLLCTFLLVLWDNIIALFFLPMMFILWLAGVAWAIILPVKTFLQKKQRHWYLALLPLCCITAATLLPFAPLPWHIWKAQLTYFCNCSSYREVIKNPTQENLISQTKERTVIAFQHSEGMLSRFENKIVYISDDALPQKEMFPFAKNVKIYRKLSPKWYYVQIEY